MVVIFLIALTLLFSCAPKVERRCSAGEELIDEFSRKYVPRNFRIYGKFRYGPLKFPMLLAKFDGIYTVRIAKAKDVRIKRDRLCIDRKCYLLPSPPEYLIFGRLLSGTEYSFCKEGLLFFRERVGVYEKLLIFEGKVPKELSVRNVKNGKTLRIIFGSMDKERYFKEITFILDSNEVKLIIEEVEL